MKTIVVHVTTCLIPKQPTCSVISLKNIVVEVHSSVNNALLFNFLRIKIYNLQKFLKDERVYKWTKVQDIDNRKNS